VKEPKRDLGEIMLQTDEHEGDANYSTKKNFGRDIPGKEQAWRSVKGARGKERPR